LLSLDVAVTIPNNLVVRGSNIQPADSPMEVGDINVTLGGEFRLRKTPDADAVFVGTVETVRGTYDFQSRRFTLADGRVRFQGNRPVDPALDVTAEREISGILAQVHIGGTARAPSLRLSSEPPMDEGEVLALIVFNRPLNELSEGERVSLAERAGAMASGFVVSPIAESLGRALDLDIFEIRGFTPEGAGPVLRVGEQVGERVFVSFEHVFGVQQVSEFMLEYQLHDLLRLKGSIAEGRQRANRSLTRRVERSGIDLVLLLRY
jgi:translocation and assembly module TamB